MSKPGCPSGCEITQRSVLRVGQNEIKRYILIARCRAALGSDAFAFETQPRSGIRPGGNGKRDRTGNGGDLDFGAENDFRKGDRTRQMNVEAFAPQRLMRLEIGRAHV